MSNPLNEQIAKLLIQIMELERDREKHQEALENPTPAQPAADAYASTTQLADELMETKRHQWAIEGLTREIDLRRQELISLELLMLDNSIKDLRSTVAQVDGSIRSLQSTTSKVDDSVKSLQETTTKVVMSSTRIEYFTLIVVLTTIANIAIFLLTINIYYSVAVSIGGIIALTRLWQKISKHPAFKLDEAENK